MKVGNVLPGSRILLVLCSAISIAWVLRAGAAPSPRLAAATTGKLAKTAPQRSDGTRSPSTTLDGGTCPSPTMIGSVPFNDSGNTSNGSNTTIFLSNACAGAGAVTREGPERVYSFSVGAGNSLTFTVTPTATWDPALYILGTCNNGSSCVAEKDTGFEGQPDTIGPITLPIGTYFFYVDSAYPADDTLG